MKQLWFIADDFGRDDAVNAGVIRAHRDGALTGAGLMPGQAATAAAVELARQHPTLHIGWHLHVCDSRPCTLAAWPWGASPWAAALALSTRRSARQLVRDELHRQWELFERTGLTCRFINAHHHLHVHPWILQELTGLFAGTARPVLRGFHVRAFDGGARLERAFAPLVRGAARRHGWATPDTLWGLDRLHAMDAAEIARVANGLPAGHHEFVFHPRDLPEDADLRALLALGRRWQSGTG